MTTIGVVTYLLLLNKPILAFISCVVFGKLIVFHFVMEYFDKKNQIQISKNREISM